MGLNRSPELYLLKTGHIPCDTLGPASFGLRGIILNILGRDPLGYAISTNYQDSRPYGSRQEDFFMFHYVRQCKACAPWGGAIFRPSGII